MMLIPVVRFWQAIRRPPELGIDRRVDEIKRAASEVIREGDANLVKSHAEQEEFRKSEHFQLLRKYYCLFG